MIGITDIIAADRVLLLERPPEKRQLLHDLAEQLAPRAGLAAGPVAEELLRREQLGSTGLGGGIALPHARFDALSRPIGMLALLRPGIGFDAIDDAPVDIVVLLLMPSNSDALKVLAAVSRALRQPELVRGLRSAPSSGAAFEILRVSGS